MTQAQFTLNTFNKLSEKALSLKHLTLEESLWLYENAPLPHLMALAHALRKKHNPDNKVGWIIDRNVNITNVCVAQCQFCNFHCKPGSSNAYITTIKEYENKIGELLKLGGNQLLLQGGLHPKLGVDFYANLFSTLKKLFPTVKLHALGPPEIVHLARKAKKGYREILQILTDAGLDSLPGAGAEILSDRVRQQLSKAKCNSQEWLDVMRQAHQLQMTTSATMMFGHLETKAERIEHLILLRDLQAQKPDTAVGFTTFIPWTFQGLETKLAQDFTIEKIAATEYIRTIAISRIMLPNIKNIQASWLTVGKDVAQICLHAGANDFGSIMIEENVVSAAGASFKFDAKGIQFAIEETGFVPRFRNQKYEEEAFEQKLV